MPERRPPRQAAGVQDHDDAGGHDDDDGHESKDAGGHGPTTRAATTTSAITALGLHWLARRRGGLA